MTDRDREVIHILECVVSGRNCEKCSLQCKAVVTDDILALIYRLKTENENYGHNIKKLTEENMMLQSKVNRLRAYDEERDIALHSRLIATSRAEAIKEFAERLKKSFNDLEYQANTTRKTIRIEELREQMDWVLHSVAIEDIDDLVKEMVGEQE